MQCDEIVTPHLHTKILKHRKMEEERNNPHSNLTQLREDEEDTKITGKIGRGRTRIGKEIRGQTRWVQTIKEGHLRAARYNLLKLPDARAH